MGLPGSVGLAARSQSLSLVRHLAGRHRRRRARHARGKGAASPFRWTSMLRYLPDAAGTPSASLSLLSRALAATSPFLLLLRRRKPSGIINGPP